MSYTKFENGIGVNIAPLPKKKKINNELYDIYFHFSISQNGIPYSCPVISTPVSVPTKEWGNQKVKGNSDYARGINNQLDSLKSEATISLQNLRSNGVNTCTENLF